MSIVFVLMLVALGFLFILVPLVVGTVILVIVSHKELCITRISDTIYMIGYRILCQTIFIAIDQ